MARLPGQPANGCPQGSRRTSKADLGGRMSLFDEVEAVLRGVPALRDELRRMGEPVRVAVAGQARAGKSTVIEALGVGGVEFVEVVAAGPPTSSVVVGTDSLGVADGGLSTGVDAVVFLVRQLGSVVAGVDRVGTIVVLSRADEAGGGRVDAMSSARQIARRYSDQHGVTVVAVAGLLARAAGTLTEAEFATLNDLATRPRAETDSVLLSADRVGDPELVRRFGMFGIRISVTLLRQGFDDPEKLAAELARRSGITELREQIGIQFGQRRSLLKARTALTAARHTDAKAEVERLVAGAHEFAEIQLLDAVRAGTVHIPEDIRAETERLLGAYGDAVNVRLGHVGDPRRTLLATLEDWQRRAESPLSSRQFAAAARVIVRTCEGMLAQITITQNR
ncbi:hypothetical protein [Actinocrispum sp. NPDC049592]|uniref:hypothetical protein n=1 Tax=Actinocrispum sp. NPDC049592 TaxID=3154835 RepID=UPI00342E2BE9